MPKLQANSFIHHYTVVPDLGEYSKVNCADKFEIRSKIQQGLAITDKQCRGIGLSQRTNGRSEHSGRKRGRGEGRYAGDRGESSRKSEPVANEHGAADHFQPARGFDSPRNSEQE